MMRKLGLKLLLRFRGDGAPGPTKRRIGSWLLRNLPGVLTCAEFEEFIHDYYEDLLPDGVRGRFEVHLQLCPMCRVHFDSYVRAVSLGQQVCAEDDRLPEGLPEELLGAIVLARRGESSQ